MAGVGGGLSRRAQLADVALAVTLFAANLLLWLLGPRDMWPPSWPVAIAWLSLGYLALALRRRAVPLAVGIIAVQTTVPQLVPGLGVDGAALLVVTYTAAAHRSLRYAAVSTLTMWLPPVAAALSPLGQQTA